MTQDEILKAYEKQRQPVECWTRVMGYFRPVSHFNEGKKSEFKMVSGKTSFKSLQEIYYK